MDHHHFRSLLQYRKQLKQLMEKLANGRAAGDDQIIGELLKYGAESLAPPITKMFNDIFQENSFITALLFFIIIPLNKPGKPPTADNPVLYHSQTWLEKSYRISP